MKPIRVWADNKLVYDEDAGLAIDAAALTRAGAGFVMFGGVPVAPAGDSFSRAVFELAEKDAHEKIGGPAARH